MGEKLSGLGVSGGRVAGRVCWMGAVPALPEVEPPVGDVAAERERAAGALGAVAGELAGLAKRVGGAAAGVLEAAALMAGDPTLGAAVTQGIDRGRAAAWAIAEAIAEQKATLAALGGYFAERAADLDDVRDRAVAHLLGLPMPGVPARDEPFVLVAEDLAPADTARLNPATVLALVTRRGGPTSHTAILAKALGIPAVVGCAGADALADGALISVDGGSGEVEVVTAEIAERINDEAAAAKRRLEASTGPGQTKDGHPVALLLNVGSAADVVDGAEGVGLFRTEFLYFGRSEAPTVEEQEIAYTKVFQKASKVVVRTLDAGADKPLPFLKLEQEENPALGVRGIRVARAQPNVLTNQLEAIARAARSTNVEVWVMAPMVATLNEAKDFADRVHAVGLPVAGVMIEVPAAALLADQILEVVDFLSIGTNDLSQYTLAADRMNADLADLLDPWQPAVLALVAACAKAGGKRGKPVGICGEAAADPLLAPVFAGFGITSLSMSAPSVSGVRAALAEYTFADCQRLAELALTDPVAAKRSLLPNT
jgi:phosphoenolpyruvate-protein phosphotransferase (PTS system enzyme I)